MSTVTISPEVQVVIPKDVRESIGLKPGQKMQVLYYNNHIALVPIRPIAEMRGFAPGIDTDIPRDEDRV